eukprot:scaffold17055_cov73-Skeletonema_marinoi.AAC.2
MSSGQEVGEIFGDGSGPAMSLLRSPTVIIAAVGLWGMNVYLFKLFKIDYVHVLTLDLIKEKETSARKGGDNKEDDNSDLCSVGSTGSIPGPTMTNRNSKGSKRRANSPGDNNNHGNSAD